MAELLRELGQLKYTIIELEKENSDVQNTDYGFQDT